MFGFARLRDPAIITLHWLEVAKLAGSERQSERYSPNLSGFASAYLGSELRLGLAESGQPPKAG